MSDTRDIRYRIYANADQLEREVVEATQKVQEFDRKMTQLGQASRNEVALARDQLSQTKLAMLERISLLERERKEVLSNSRAIATERINQIRTTAAAELATLERVYAAKVALLNKEQADRNTANALRKQQIASLAKDLKLLEAQAEAAARDLEKAQKLRTSLGARDTVPSLRNAVQQKAEVDARKAARLKENLDSLVLAKQDAINRIKEEDRITRNLSSQISERKAHLASEHKLAVSNARESSRQRIAAVSAETTQITALRERQINEELANLRLLQRQQAVIQSQVLQHANDIRQSQNASVQGIRNLGQATSNIGQSMARIGTGMAFAISLPGIAAIHTGLKFNAMKENALNAFTSMLGNADKAKAVMAELYQFAKPTAFEFQNIVATANKLMVAGVSEQHLLPVLKRIAALTALAQVSGKDPATVINQVGNLISKIESRSSITQGHLNSINLIIGFTDKLLQKMGVENATLAQKEKLYAMIKARQISSGQALNALFEAIDEKSAGLLERQQASFDGLKANLADTLGSALGLITETLFEDFKTFLSWLIPKIDQLANAFRALDPVTRQWILGLSLASIALGPVLIIMGRITSILGGLVTGFALLKTASLAFATSVGAAETGVLAGLSFAFTKLTAVVVGFVNTFWGFILGIPAAVASIGTAISSYITLIFTAFIYHGFWPTITAMFTTLATSVTVTMATIYAAVISASIAFFKFAIPIALLVTIVTAAVETIIDKWDLVKNIAIKTWAFLVDYYQSNLAVPLQSATDTIMSYMYDAWRGAVDFFKSIFAGVLDWINENWGLITDATRNAFDAIKNIILIGLAVIREFWVAFGPSIIDTLVAVWESIKEIVYAAMHVIGSIIKLVLSLIAGDWDKFWESVGELTRNAGDLLASIFKAIGRILFNIVKAIVSGLMNLMQNMYNKITMYMYNAILGMADAIWSAAPNVIDAFGQLGANSWAAFMRGLSGTEIARGSAVINVVTNAPPPSVTTEPGEVAAGSNPDGAHGFEGYELPELGDGGKGGKKGKHESVTQDYDKAAAAVEKLRTDVMAANEQLHRYTSAQRTAMQQLFTDIADVTNSYEDLKEKLRVDPNNFTLKNQMAGVKLDLEAQVNAISNMAIQADKILAQSSHGIVGEIFIKGNAEMSKQLAAFEDKYINSYKAGTAKRREGEAALVEYKSLLETQFQNKLLQGFKKIYDFQLSNERKLTDIRFENSFSEAEQKIEANNRALTDYKKQLEETYGRALYVGQLALEVKHNEMKKALAESYNRWRLDKERDLNRALQDSRAAATNDSYTSQRLQVARGIEDFVRQQRSLLLTSKTTAEERAAIEAKLVEYTNNKWAEFHLKETERVKEEARRKRDINNALIFDELTRRQAELKAVGQDAYDNKWKEVAHDLWGVVTAVAAAKQAQDEYNAILRAQLELELKRAFLSADPNSAYDVNKQQQINKLIKDAIPVMLQYGVTLDYVKQIMGGVALNAESFSKALKDIEDAITKGKGVQKQKKSIEELRKTYKEQLKDLFSLEALINRFGQAIGDAFEAWASGAATLGDALKSSLLGALADLASAAGQVFIGWAAAELAAGNFAKAAGLFAAGFALKALGGFLAAKAKSAASNAAGTSTAGGGAGASAAADSTRDDRVRGTDFNTYGPNTIVVKFDTKNMNKGMREMFRGVSTTTTKDAKRRVRQQLIDVLG